MNISHLPKLPSELTLPDGTRLTGTLMRVASVGEEGKVEGLTLMDPKVPTEFAPGDRYLVVYVLEQTFSCKGHS